ncbi:MAG: acyl-CoA dehydrogenase family protein [Thermodesulfobacteriota bacterium]|nr:acyl-CoA dehydrogenase family protein [Thermodesulfobacteriota bacterium]
MDFEFTDEQKMVKDMARKLMEKEIIPIADEYDRTKALMDRKKLKELTDKLVPLGYFGLRIPEEAGGAGTDFMTWGILKEELARAYASLAGIILIQSSSRVIYEVGAPALKERFLPSLVTGEKILCCGITEPNVGSDASRIETMAILDGDHYVINGTKTWISNGSISDACILVAQTEKGAGAAGICHILLDREESPYETRELSKLGLRSFPTSELFLEDCRVPKENLLVEPGQGHKKVLQLFEGARANMAINSVGMAQAAIDASITYAKERHQFGKPLAAMQMIQEMVADMIAETEAARLLSFRAFSLLDKGVRCDAQSSLAKYYATEIAVNVTSKAIQIHGAYGLSDEYPVERYFRDARSSTIPDGTTQIQKMIVARDALGVSAFV